MQGLTGLNDSQRSRLDALRTTHNKLRARHGLAPLSLAEFADHYRAEAAARGSSSTFLDPPATRQDAGGGALAFDPFQQLNAGYVERLRGGQPKPSTAAAPGPSREGAAEASSKPREPVGADPFARLNAVYDAACAHARVGGAELGGEA